MTVLRVGFFADFPRSNVAAMGRRGRAACPSLVSSCPRPGEKRATDRPALGPDPRGLRGDSVDFDGAPRPASGRLNAAVLPMVPIAESRPRLRGEGPGGGGIEQAVPPLSRERAWGCRRRHGVQGRVRPSLTRTGSDRTVTRSRFDVPEAAPSFGRIGRLGPFAGSGSMIPPRRQPRHQLCRVWPGCDLQQGPVTRAVRRPLGR